MDLTRKQLHDDTGSAPNVPPPPPPPPPQFPLDRGRTANGRLRRTLTVLASSSFALLAATPAFPQSAAWVSEIDFAKGKFEVQVGGADVDLLSLEVCYHLTSAIDATSDGDATHIDVCDNSDEKWTADSYHTYEIANLEKEASGSLRILGKKDKMVFSFVQWGAGNQGGAQAAVVAGVWADDNEYIEKPSELGHSMQYWNRNGVVPGRDTWVSRMETIGFGNDPLEPPEPEQVPVELVSFTAQGVAAGVLLKWRTESETANSGFQILRSNNKNNPFQSIHNDLIPGHGSTPHPNNYQYTDITAKPGTKYHYKLQDVAHDGKTQYSQTITARAGTPAP